MMSPICADLLSFIHHSPTPYHAVESAIARLSAAGFTPLSEAGSFVHLPPGRYFVPRGDSALLAFVLPEAGIRGFRILGAHTDSPNLRLKPRPAYVKEGYLQLGVEVYGGALLNSWLDRDLALAGRIIFRDPTSDGEREPGRAGGLLRRLVRIERPLLRIPQLAIHLDREVNERGVVLNKQEHLAPVLGLLPAHSGVAPMDALLALCAAEVWPKDTPRDMPKESIVSIELMLYDVTPPTTAGLHEELIFSARLDNQAMCHASLIALIEAATRSPDSPQTEGLCPVIALFDHEEVGSDSAYGAASPALPALLERLIHGKGGSREDYHQAISRSLCVSADMAHAVHPNYVDRHEARHRPVLNGGPVIKINSQQRYATCARTGALFQELCRKEGVPVQQYANRTDLPCGSTIGPITSTQLGIRTVDVGNPMLSMHSAREMAGSHDPEMMTRVLTRFLGCADPFCPV